MRQAGIRRFLLASLAVLVATAALAAAMDPTGCDKASSTVASCQDLQAQLQCLAAQPRRHTIYLGCSAPGAADDWDCTGLQFQVTGKKFRVTIQPEKIKKKKPANSPAPQQSGQQQQKQDDRAQQQQQQQQQQEDQLLDEDDQEDFQDLEDYEVPDGIQDQPPGVPLWVGQSETGSRRAAGSCRPALTVGGSETLTTPLFSVSDEAALALRGVSVMLAGRRPGIQATGAQRLVLADVEIRGGAQGSAVSATDTPVVMSGGGVYSSAAAGNESMGGAVYCETSSEKKWKSGPQALVLSNVTLDGNSASFGGAVALINARAAVQNCSFTNNRAAADGGALYSDTSFTSQGNVLGVTMTRTKFTGNQAGARGGALFSDGGRAVMDASTFEANTGAEGGAIHFRMSSALSAPQNPSGGKGDTLLTLRKVKASGNKASNRGGAMFVFSAGTRMQACELSSNTAGGAGGGVFFRSPVPGIKVSLSMAGGAVEGNSALRGGGLALEDGSLDASKVNLTSNTATKEGGALHFRPTTAATPPVMLTIRRGQISGNQAGTQGGGMWTTGAPFNNGGTQFSVVLQSTKIESNQAVEEGGGMCAYDTCMVAARNTFRSNTASAGGGAAFFSSQPFVYVKAFVSMKSQKFIENGVTGNRGGSGIYFLKQSTAPMVMSIKNARFENNAQADGPGSAFMMVRDDGRSPGKLKLEIKATYSGNTPLEGAVCGTLKLTPPSTSTDPKIGGRMSKQGCSGSVVEYCNDYCRTPLS